MGSFWAFFREPLLILKDIPASLGFVLQNLRGGGVREFHAVGRLVAIALNPLVFGLVTHETIEEPQP